MFFKMVFRALTRRKGKHLMTAFTVGLGVSLATAMLGVMFDVGDKVNRELKTYGANLSVIPRGSSVAGEKYEFADEADAEGAAGEEGAIDRSGHAGHAGHSGHSGHSVQDFLSRARIPEDELHKIKMIFWAYNIVDFAPFLSTTVFVGDNPVNLTGTWFDKRMVLPTGDEVETGVLPLKSWWEIRGEAGDDSLPLGVMAGETLARELSLEPGSSLEVSTPAGEKINLTVRGIFRSGGEEDNELLSPMKLAQDISGLGGLVDRVEVSALTTPENDLARRAAKNPGSLSRMEWDTWYCTAYISSIAYQIEEILPGVRVKAVMRVAESEGTILRKTQLMMLLLTLLTLLCSALAISNLVTANIMERSVEIGLMKALGATNLSVSLLILSEMLAAAFLGGAGGYLVGLGLARFIGLTVFGTAVEVKTVVIPLAALMVIFVTFLGSLPALRALLKLKPTEVLHGR